MCQVILLLIGKFQFYHLSNGLKSYFEQYSIMTMIYKLKNAVYEENENLSLDFP